MSQPVAILLVILFAAAAGLLALGSRRTGVAAAAGTAAGSSVPALPKRLRIGTFNICQGRGSDRRTRLARTARELHALDIVCLQEVRGAPWLGRTGQIDRLAALAGLPVARYLGAERRWWRDWLGHGLLARIAPAAWSLEPMPNSEHKAWRSLARFRFGSQDAGFDLIALHAARRADRDAQIARAIECLLATERGILAGDFNCDAAHPALRALIDGDHGVTDPLATLAPPVAAGAAPEPRFDFLLVRGLTVIDSGMRAGPASDHPLYWVEVEVPADTDDARRTIR